MKLGTQYYRPPFPEQNYWEEDFARIKDSGLNTVQLWVLWAWVESKPESLFLMITIAWLNLLTEMAWVLFSVPLQKFNRIGFPALFPAVN